MAMKRLQIIAFAVVCLAAAACDPGMTIRQRASDTQPGQGPGPDRSVDVRVGTAHPLIGEDWYVPDVSFTNRGDVRLTVTRAELLGPSGLTPCAPADLSHLPEEVPPGQTRRLLPYFKLKHAVQEEFASTAELKLYYTDGKTERATSIVLEGGPLE